MVKVNINSLLIGVAILFIIYSMIYWTTDWLENKKFIDYTFTTYNLGLIFTIIALILDSSQKQEERQREETQDYLTEVQNAYVNIEKMFMENDPYLFPLYKELNGHNPFIQNLSIPPDLDQAKAQRLESSMANIIFQGIETIIITNTLDGHNTTLSIQQKQNLEAWRITWKTWFMSPTLQKLWVLNKHFFAQNTIFYVDQLIQETNEDMVAASMAHVNYHQWLKRSKKIQTNLEF